ncbi:MAG: ribosomal-protein-alanine N-acetyltransferase [Legionella sp.]|nr:MAG: ribosomal-protein-alanine N-acetyltransferase [Legionella sp.]
MSAIIRRMQTTDLDQVYAIETQVHITPWSKEILRDCVLVGYDCRVLELDQDILGYIISRKGASELHILNLCVRKDKQSQGYGRQLIEKVLQAIIESTAIKSVVLEVRPSNVTALHLYTSLGFQQSELKKNYYKDGESTEDAVFLKKVLTRS